MTHFDAPFPVTRPAPERRSRIRTNLARLEPPHRIAGVDLARGLAVIGVFAAHLAVIETLEWSNPGTWSGVVEGRSSVLFAMLAGVSLGIVSTSTKRRRESRGPGATRPLWGLRVQLLLRGILMWLLGIWLDDLDVPVYVILPAYGVLFVLAIPFTSLAPRYLFTLSAALALIAPFAVWWINSTVATSPNAFDIDESLRLIAWNYPIPFWMAFMFCGMAAGTLLVHSVRYAWALLGAGIVLTVIGYGVIGSTVRAAAGPDEIDYAALGTPEWWFAVWQDAPHSSGIGEALGSGGFALAVMSAAVLLCLTPLRWIALPLRAVGSMPLTAYVAHIGIWAIWLAVETARNPSWDPWLDFRALDPFWPMTLWIVAGCTLWALLFTQGPLEWVLGKVTKVPRRWDRVTSS